MILQDTCKGCPNRTVEPVNCHTTCEKYLKAVELKHEIEERKRQAYSVETARAMRKVRKR